MNFQGRLLSNTGAVVSDGNYNMEFKLYAGGPGNVAGDTGGTLVWTEDWLNYNTQGVVVKNGYFSVQLGTLTALPASVNLDNSVMWLSMTVANGSSPNGATSTTCTTFAGCNSSSEPEMLPMKSLSAAPFALNADNANQVNSNGVNNNFLDLAVPGTPTVATTTGSLTGTFYYVVTATNAAGETVASACSASVSPSGQGVTVSWSQVSGATGYRIYRNTSCAFTSGSLLLTSISGGQNTSFTDGSVSTTTGLPPTTVTGTTVTLQAWNSQTAKLLNLESSAGSSVLTVDPSGNGVFAGSLQSVGVNSGSGLVQGTGGLTVTGTVQVNTTGAGTTTIGSSSAGAISIQGGSGTTTINDTGGNLTLETTTSGTLAATSAGALNLTGAANSTWTVGAGNSLGVTSSNFNVSTGGVINVVGGSAGYEIGGTAASGSYLRGNGTSFVSSAIQPGDIPVCSGTCNYLNNSAQNSFASQSANEYLASSNASHPTAQFTQGASATASVLLLQGGATPGAGGNLIVGQNSSSANVFTVGPSGQLTVTTATNSTTAFQVQNAAGVSTLTADTSNMQVTTENLNVGQGVNVSTASRIFSDGFESDDDHAWIASGGGSTGRQGTVADITFTNTPPNGVHSGRYAAVITTTANSAAEETTFPAQNTLYGRTYFNVNTLGNPTYLMDIGSAAIGSGNHMVIELGASGDLCYSYNGGTATCSATAPSTTVWHKLEMEITNGGAMDYWLDNTLIANVTGGAWSGTTWNNFALGTLTSSTATVTFDDVAVDSQATGDSGSAYVQDSLHVAGYSSFGNGLFVTGAGSSYGLLANANGSGIGIQGGSNNGISGYFQSSGSSNSAATLEVQQNSSATGNLFQVNSSTPATMFSISSTGAVLSKNSANSTSAFQVQNAGGVALLTVDSTDERLYVGPTAGDTTGELLVLGNKTSSGDPTEVDGAMYYNSNLGAFRCGESGIWVDCMSGLISDSTTASTAVNTCTTACLAFDKFVALPANYCVTGRIIHLVAYGLFSTSGSSTQLGFIVYIGTSTTQTSDTQIASPSSAMPVAARSSNYGWSLEFDIHCESATTVLGEGSAHADDGASGNLTGMNGTGTNTPPMSAGQNIYIAPAWGASSASNTAMLNTITAYFQ